MRIRDARVRDVMAIIDLLPEDEKCTYDELVDKIQDSNPPIFVATDFSANVLGCAIGADKVYIKENCAEPGIENELRAKY